MKKYVEPKTPEEALKRLRTAINFICRGKVNDYKPEAKKLLDYLEQGLISLEEFKRKIEESAKGVEAIEPTLQDTKVDNG